MQHVMSWYDSIYIVRWNSKKVARDWCVLRMKMLEKMLEKIIRSKILECCEYLLPLNRCFEILLPGIRDDEILYCEYYYYFFFSRLIFV